MKITVAGCGNMGGAIVRGLVRGRVVAPEDVSATDVNSETLTSLAADAPGIRTELDAFESVAGADIIILAVKPWIVESVIDRIKFRMDYSRQILVSIAAGVSIAELEKSLEKHSDENSLPVIFRIIPNTAIAIGKSVNLIATENASDEQKTLIDKLFSALGTTVFLDEDRLNAGTALTSCGIAYMFRFIRAATLAGVEMGFYPAQAQQLAIDTMLGAASLLKSTGENPEKEIDKVTTPGGITIRGLNTLEAGGFSTAIINALKASKF
jgi:pyrroline-5-carboxylate reductase